MCHYLNSNRAEVIGRTKKVSAGIPTTTRMELMGCLK